MYGDLMNEQKYLWYCDSLYHHFTYIFVHSQLQFTNNGNIGGILINAVTMISKSKMQVFIFAEHYTVASIHKNTRTPQYILNIQYKDTNSGVPVSKVFVHKSLIYTGFLMDQDEEPVSKAENKCYIMFKQCKK